MTFFQVEMEQLRATLKSDLEEKNEILDKLTHERGAFWKQIRNQYIYCQRRKKVKELLVLSRMSAWKVLWSCEGGSTGNCMIRSRGVLVARTPSHESVGEHSARADKEVSQCYSAFHTKWYFFWDDSVHKGAEILWTNTKIRSAGECESFPARVKRPNDWLVFFLACTSAICDLWETRAKAKELTRFCYFRIGWEATVRASWLASSVLHAQGTTRWPEGKNEILH